MPEDRNKLSGLSFSTILCLIVFLMFAIKAGIVFYFFYNEHKPDILSEKKEENYARDTDQAIAEQADTVSMQSNDIMEPELSVLITNSSGIYTHKNIEITGTSDYMIKSVAGTENFTAGESVDLADYFFQKSINICSVSLLTSEPFNSCSLNSEMENSITDQAVTVYQKNATEEQATVNGIQLLSLEKGGISPVYPGTLQIQWDSQKQEFYVVNEIKLEQYLPGVVSSEMPDRFGLEALKTQAVCARSYALFVLENGKKQSIDSISWNLVDTTDDQVYMSGPVDTLAVIACEETCGEILFQENSPIKPHYYSTSWGEQADGGVFSGEEPLILEAVAVVARPEKEIMAINETFKKTYEQLEQNISGENVSYDLESPWFRWSCSIPLSEIGEKKVESMTVTKRGTGGYVSCLLISYADGTAEQISGASSIRERLGLENTLYYLKDGSTRSGLSILPSAFFYLDSPEIADGIPIIELHGGGFGHGYGMSQYGAAKMAETGHKYTEILSYYYNSAQICEYY